MFALPPGSESLLPHTLKVLVQVGEESSLLSSLDYFRRDTIFAWSFDTGEGVDGLVEFLYSG